MAQASTLTITDPVFEKEKKPSLIGRFLMTFLRDERDIPIGIFAIKMNLLLLPYAIILFWPGVFRWWLGLPYPLIAFAIFAGPYINLLHNISHRPVFKKQFKFLNTWLVWVNGPLIGQTPETYYAHHMGMHHYEGNLPADHSSTMKHQRDSIFGFLAYYLEFFLIGFPQLALYLYRKKRYKVVVNMIVGEFSYLALAAFALYFHTPAAICVFVIPFVLERFLLMAGNWGQHAFVDHDEPDNDYKSSITFINSKYNHLCFNDGYHIAHHLEAARHWMTFPEELQKNKQKYIDNKALIFHTTDFFQIFLMLMGKKYKKLASYVVQLDEKNPMSEEQIIELIKSRMKKFDKATLAKYTK